MVTEQSVSVTNLEVLQIIRTTKLGEREKGSVTSYHPSCMVESLDAVGNGN